MKTEAIYLADIYSVRKIDNSFYYTLVDLEYVKPALIQYKRNIFGVAYMKDLNTNEKYKIELPSKIGALYVSKSSMELFNDVTNNKDLDLSKEKIKSLGNKYLKK